MSHWSQGIADMPQRSRINANTVVRRLTGQPAKMGSRSCPLSETPFRGLRGSGTTIRGQSGHFVVITRGFCGNLRGIQCSKLLIRELGDMHGAPIQISQALIFLGREQHDIVAAVAGHDYRFPMGYAPEAAELTLKFAGGDSGHKSHLGSTTEICRNALDAAPSLGQLLSQHPPRCSRSPRASCFSHRSTAARRASLTGFLPIPSFFENLFRGSFYDSPLY